tara:strand:- start:7295 stop:7528 length:234 start_codon:yes stop_codon:yes gene_type:complete
MVSFKEAKRTMKKQNESRTIAPEAVTLFQEKAELLLDRFAQAVELAMANDTRRGTKVRQVHVDIGFAKIITGEIINE